MKVGQVFAAWGKPRSIFLWTDGSPTLAYADQPYTFVQIIVDLTANAVTNVDVTLPKTAHAQFRRLNVEECLQSFGEPPVRNPVWGHPAGHTEQMIYDRPEASIFLAFADDGLRVVQLSPCSSNHISQP
jgi:hypothetical protein